MEEGSSLASSLRLKHCRHFAVSLVLITATTIGGLIIRFAPLGLPQGIVKYGGSMLWAFLIYWIAGAFLPSSRPLTVALLAATLSTAVELFKLHHTPALDTFRLTVPGMLLLGRFFSGWDIVAYWFAIFIGMQIDTRIRSSEVMIRGSLKGAAGR